MLCRLRPASVSETKRFSAKVPAELPAIAPAYWSQDVMADAYGVRIRVPKLLDEATSMPMVCRSRTASSKTGRG